MNLIRNAVFTAAIAGLFAGLIMTALQTFATVPLILQAETYEGAPLAGHGHGAVEMSAAEAPDPGAVAPDDRGEGAWAPADGVERFAFTALANIVTGIGFALVLVAVSEFAGGIAGWRKGVFWGFAGFAVFTLAPGLGLPPELPAMPAADLFDRQVWWVATVAATACGLALIAFRGTALFSLIGVALIVAPHIIGAPQPASHETPVPAALHHQFVVATTVTSLIFWVLLGGVVGSVRQRFLGTADKLSKSFA